MNDPRRLAELIPDAFLALTGRILPSGDAAAQPKDSPDRMGSVRTVSHHASKPVASITVLHPPSAA